MYLCRYLLVCLAFSISDRLTLGRLKCRFGQPKVGVRAAVVAADAAKVPEGRDEGATSQGARWHLRGAQAAVLIMKHARANH